MESKLPERWHNCKLGDVLTIQNGYAFPSNEYKRVGIPLIRQSNLAGNKVSLNNCVYLEGKYATKKKDFILRKGDILIGMSGSIGKLCRYDLEKVGLQNQRTGKVVVNEKRLSKKFVWHYLNTIEKKLQEKGKGLGISNVSADDIESLEILLPPIDEQERIADKLDVLLAKVKDAQSHLDKIPLILNRFRQSVLAAACSGRLTADWREKNQNNECIESTIKAIRRQRETAAVSASQKEKLRQIYENPEGSDSDELPENWRYVALKKLCSSFDYGTSTKSKPTGKIPVLRMGNIQDGEIDWTDLVYTSDDDEIKKYLLKPNTVLFNRTNSPELVGKTAIYCGERQAIFAGYLIRINPFAELNPEYLHLCLNTSYAKEFCLSVKTDGVSQSNINAQKLGAFEVPFCSLAEQQEIVRRVHKLFVFVDHIEDRYSKAQAYTDKLEQSILAKAFRGELVPQDSKGEPASELLKRLGSIKEKISVDKRKNSSKI